MNVIEFATSRSWSSWVTLTASLAIIVFLLHRFRDPRVDTTTSEPTVAPYTIPHFQHLIAFLWNPGKLYRSMQAEYSGRPFTLWLNNTKFHVFFDPSTVNHVFGRSRAFSFDPVLASMMGNAVMLPPDDLLKFCPPAELRGKDRANSRKYIMSDHSIWSKFLTGEPLDELMRAFLRNFNIVLEQHLDPHSADWQTVDINELVKRSIFETTVLTFYGPRLKQIWGDNMWDDWKTYDRATYIGVRSKLAITLQPRVYFAYKRMMAAFEEWIDSMNYRWPDTDKVWDDKWGARMIWERDRLAVESGFSFRGRACLQASCLFASTTNLAPLSSWFAFCAAQTRGRLDKYRVNAASFILPPGPDGEFCIDIARLRQNPYIQGLWKETIRLGTATAAARVVTEDSVLEGFTVRKGSVLLMPVELMHYDEHIFPDPRELKPERWMIDDPEQLAAQNKRLRAFGGGASLCSGRFMAELEVIGAISVLLLRFDIEFDHLSTSWEFNPRSLGMMSPVKAPIARLRPRSSYQRTE